MQTCERPYLPSIEEFLQWTQHVQGIGDEVLTAALMEEFARVWRMIGIMQEFGASGEMLNDEYAILVWNYQSPSAEHPPYLQLVYRDWAIRQYGTAPIIAGRCA